MVSCARCYFGNAHPRWPAFCACPSLLIGSLCCIGLRYKPKYYLKKNMYMRKNFIVWCRSVRCLSEQTCIHYEKITSLFETYCESVAIPLDRFTPNDVNRWIIAQSSEGIKAVTINNRVSCLRMMYDYACRFEGWQLNPFVAVEKLKVPKLLPKFIEDITIRRAVAAIQGIGFFEVRARTLVMFLYMTGVRRAELAAIRVSDVSIDSRIVRIYGKGRKERICPLPETLIPLLLEWQAARAGMLPRDSQWYFCSSVGHPMSNTAIAQVIHMVFDAWLPRKMCHPHVLRHSFATHLMRAGVPIVDIARLMGHTSTATTLRYLSLAPDAQYSSMLDRIF